MKGLLFNIQKFSIGDGPGIRTTVFFKGCPLRCLWCHNPESQRGVPERIFHAERCAHCGRCRGVAAEDDRFFCLHGARELCGREWESDEVLREVLKDRDFYETSGGGLTLSGGEPLAQFLFARELLQKAHSAGLHTALETCGYAPAGQLEELAGWTDLFLYDYKETDPIRHRDFTGVGNRLILENLALLGRLGKPVILRCPIVPGCNDRPDHFAAIAALANAHPTIERVELAPYHSFGEQKYPTLGRRLPAFSVPDEEQKRAWLAAVSENCAKPVAFTG